MSVLTRGRRMAESRMTSTCTATVSGGEPVWDNTQGEYVAPPPTVLYDGPCRLRLGNPAPQNADAGETTWAVDRGVLSLPIDGTANVPDGATVTITGNPHDPGMVGLVLTVLAGHFQTDSTARRLPVQVVTRDA